MPVKIIVGMQWGDEGKGKIIDVFSLKALHIVRAQGGHNAGHTVIVSDRPFFFHLVPSGILYEHTTCYLGGGVVIEPYKLMEEVESIEARGVSVKGRLFVSPYAHVILPEHVKRDQESERALGDKAIGTTGRGIGPCYYDKVGRKGVRICEYIHQCEPNMHKFLQPLIAPVEQMLDEAVKRGEEVLLEGAQGTLLDVSYGTYPYVTSSNTTAAGICMGSGLPPTAIDEVIGVIKAYQTRVGNGPFPTEFSFVDPRSIGEVGTTTGRVRRIGWFDAPLARFAAARNGVKSLALMKMDILGSLPSVRICVGYEREGKTIDVAPTTLENVKPLYIDLPGWKCDICDCKHWKELPIEAQKYVHRIEEICEVKVAWISTGPRRDQIIEVGKNR